MSSQSGLLGGTKVCFISHRFAPCTTGIALSASRIVDYLMDAGAEVHVVVPEFIEDDSPVFAQSKYVDFNQASRKTKTGALVYELPVAVKQGRVSSSMWPLLSDLVESLDKQHSFDIFHGFGLPLAYPALVPAKKSGRPIIASIRGADGLSLLGSENLSLISAVLSNATWVTSVASDLLSNAGAIECIGDRSSVLANGIDSVGFPCWDERLFERGAVGMAAVHRYKKGTAVLVDAYAKVTSDIRKKLYLIGRYDECLEERKVMEILRENDLHHQCIHTPELNREDLLAAISKLGVFVLPSLHDGMPNALLEAAALGVPIIASDVGAMSDVLEHSENALLVNPGDASELSGAIESVLCDRQLRQVLSEGGRALAEKFSIFREKAAWVDLYLDLTSS